MVEKLLASGESRYNYSLEKGKKIEKNEFFSAFYLKGLQFGYSVTKQKLCQSRSYFKSFQCKTGHGWHFLNICKNETIF